MLKALLFEYSCKKKHYQWTDVYRMLMGEKIFRRMIQYTVVLQTCTQIKMSVVTGIQVLQNQRHETGPPAGYCQC